MFEKISKVISVFKKDGFSVAFGKVFRYIKGTLKKTVGIKYAVDFAKRSDEYSEILDTALSGDCDRIIVWRSSFGWNVPLFQRPQHISKALSEKRCLIFYEVTDMTDPVVSIEKHSDMLYLVNFSNRRMSNLLFSKLDTIKKPKYLQFYSTDWTLSVEFVKDLSDRGYGILYEYIDEINPLLAGTSSLPKNISEKYDYVMSEVDKVSVVVTADIIRDDVISKRGDKNLAYAANGVDYDFFTDLSSPPVFSDKFSKILESGKILIGYYGAMASWLDYDLIKKIDATNKYTVVLFGIRYDDSLDQSGILNLPNVKFMGPVDYKELKYYASKLDILTIPFLINDITKATSPLKLFEYMALHKPIVTSAMNECMKFKSPLTAHDNDEFLRLLEKAFELKDDEEYKALCDLEARENSWRTKADTVLSLLKSRENAGS